MKLDNKKIFITGASGFIGSHLVEGLVKQGCKVYALVHYNGRNDWGNLEFLDVNIKSSIEIVLGDVQDPSVMRKAIKGCDVVFHLASLIAIPYSYIAPQSYVATNVMGTLNVMQACLDHHVGKVIHTSTSEVYGSAIYTPIDEKHPLQGQSPYSASKIGADKIAESFYYSFQLPLSILRPFNTFGPRQSARAVIPTIVTQALTEEKIKLGLLTPVRDLVYVKDTVEAFIASAECDESVGKTIHVGRGEGITIGDLARKILSLMNLKKEIVSDNERLRPEASEVMKLICNFDQAKSLFNWKPKYSLDKGLEETIAHIETHIAQYKTNRYTV